MMVDLVDHRFRTRLVVPLIPLEDYAYEGVNSLIRRLLQGGRSCVVLLKSNKTLGCKGDVKERGMGGLPAIVIALTVTAADGSAAKGASTNFGIREIGVITLAPVQPDAVKRAVYRPLRQGAALQHSESIDLKAASALASRWGRVTSTWRSAERNRRVGGVANSYHLSGRAIDIARSPHVNHAQIAEDFRRNGYHLIESLDEGDHSHFAFGFGVSHRAAIHRSRNPGGGRTVWRIVSAPR